MPRDQQIPSRRAVLRGAAGVGAAGVAATALAGVAGQALAAPAKQARSAQAVPGDSPAADSPAADSQASEQIVVHVRDARTGRIDLYRGTGQAQVHDTDLAARLVRAAGEVR
jgi:hypothetical protein